MEITVTISRNVEHWGGEDEDQPVVDKAAQLLADTIAAEINEAYPDADVTATTAETIDGQSLRTVRCTGAPDDETWETVTGYAARAEDLWEWCLKAGASVAEGSPAAILPGYEAGPCPHCGNVVVVRFDACGADVEGICPECSGSIWSPADATKLAWFGSEASMVNGECERT